ncbi:hypothetical protein [Acetobacterium sp.]|uniref:hypothetical protein n=1 Tax=Acetobacterium sp. TaxID=1872094 RepID=UPI002F408F36
MKKDEIRVVLEKLWDGVDHSRFDDLVKATFSHQTKYEQINVVGALIDSYPFNSPDYKQMVELHAKMVKDQG